MQETFALKLRNCLAQRLGTGFFHSIPETPGVYLMRDECQRVVYVGKAKNLRQRLRSYCHVPVAARKTARLVRVVRGISWEVLASEEEALLRENVLLRELRPRFNRANTFPQRHAFIAVEREAGEVTVSITRTGTSKCFGAFNGATCSVFGALCRVLWTSLHRESYRALPRPLLVERAPTEFNFAGDDAAHRRLMAFLRGERNEFATEIMCEASPFFASFRASDLAVLSAFFESGPLRNRLFREKFGLGEELIAPAALDDLAVRWRFAQRQHAAASRLQDAVKLLKASGVVRDANCPGVGPWSNLGLRAPVAGIEAGCVIAACSSPPRQHQNKRRLAHPAVA